MKRLLFTALLAAACGNADIVAPETLSIVDTYPGNGSLVGADEKTIVLSFSADIEEATLAPAVSLEESSAGAALPVALTFVSYDAPSFTARFESEPLRAGTTFALKISAATLKAKTGAQLRSDVTRSFRTIE